MSNFISKFLNNIVPPPVCLLCGAVSSGQAFCTSCLADFPRLPDLHCPCCALPVHDKGLCGRCLKAHPAFDVSLAAFLYAGPLAQLIPAAKFGLRWALLPALAELMLPQLLGIDRPDLLLPLPLHPRRLQERGFNQAMEIAQPWAKALQIPLGNGLLVRTRDTEHQARLAVKARLKNMRGAFSVRASLSGGHIVLVDDVMTTGASLDAAAKALKQAGADRVDCWVLARTP